MLLLFACDSNSETSSIEEETIYSVEETEDSNEIERIDTIGNYIKNTTEKALNERADLIVVGSTRQDFLERNHVTVYTSPEPGITGSLEDFYTITSIDVNEVLKSDPDRSIEEGSQIDVVEPIVFMEENGREFILTTEDYVEIQKNVDYIIYLAKNTYGEYGVINMNSGKFSLEEESLSLMIANGQENDSDEYLEIREEVFERYNHVIEDKK